ncbi:hypothetical protein BDV32DRAFT_132621 [Aspergillus pseudonomiae]|uniref:Inhibitor I9 domain-containing protein n=1 Tax=Aspergillus pseudonomiae TaxID=1506151 RepID=A0A5N6HIN8_9EURO|nr:uncharacterized protein BDV37DRAFT_265159 [Aspergillus pseudonomiae]KAB8254306.1 hypothetical protein BDV32DRAFT_132621 [Aspergillus pseudonomiae]KAE8397644.1 hypothetical protein BDV37DRAFT_265159 [Aspergillus pseudonomiae]
MPTYIVTCADDASHEEIQQVKKDCVDRGGRLEREFTLIKAFSVTFDEESIVTLESSPHVKSVEVDSVMTTQ